MRIEMKAAVLGVAASALVLSLTFGLALFLQSSPAADAAGKSKAASNPTPQPTSLSGPVERGHGLFEHNCAHCHGDDARGDEGPTLYNLVLSDARIAKRIKEGIKGEMPRFGSKLNDAEIGALIAFLRTLTD